MLNEFWRKLYDTVGCNSWVATFADPTRKIACIDTYTYSVDYLNTVTPVTNAGLSSNLIMDSDSDFVAQYFSCGAVVAGTTAVIPNPAINVQITNKSSGKNFFNAPSPVPMIAGYAGFPFILTSPRVIKPRSTLMVSYASILAGQSFSGFFFSIHGARIFYE